MSFMHSESVVFFLPRLPLSVSRLAAFEGYVSTGWNWTGWKLQNPMFSFPQKHPSRRFFLPSLSFDTHSSHLSSLRDLGDLSFPQKWCSRRFFLPSLSFDTHSSHLSSLRHLGDLSFPQKRCSQRFFLPSLSFDTHSSHLSSLHHWAKAKNLVYFQQFLSF